MIPAYINRLNYNERKHFRYSSIQKLTLGVYFTWLFGIAIPDNPANVLSWQFIGMFIVMGFIILSYLKMIKYKKLIKLESKIKCIKEQDIENKEEGDKKP